MDAFCLSSTVLLMPEAAWDGLELLQRKEENKEKEKNHRRKNSRKNNKLLAKFAVKS